MIYYEDEPDFYDDEEDNFIPDDCEEQEYGTRNHDYWLMNSAEGLMYGHAWTSFTMCRGQDAGQGTYWRDEAVYPVTQLSQPNRLIAHILAIGHENDTLSWPITKEWIALHSKETADAE